MESAARGWILLALGFFVAACSTGPTMTVDGGVGSQFGNYVIQEETGALVIDGQACKLFSWDRPLPEGLLLRLTSASCPAKGHPGRFVAIDAGRKLLPLSAASAESGIR